MSQLLTETDCAAILSKIVNSKFKITKFTLENVSSDAMGFLAEHFLLKILYTLDEEPLQATFFIKSCPQSRSYITDLGFMQREVTFYKHIISKLQDLVPKKFSPHFYLGRPDILVLENLQASNFNVSPDIYLDKPKIQSVIKNLANMHAASMIFESVHGSMLDKFPEDLTQNAQDYSKGNMRYEWRKNGVKCVAKLCKYFTNVSGIEAKILEYFYLEAPGFEQVNASVVNVFCHKDLWGNNLMFNSDNESCFVDFQLSKYGPPAWDFLSTLYFNLEYAQVDKYLDEFIDIYYDTLASVLSKEHGAKVFTKQDFLGTIEVYKRPVLFEVGACCTYIYLVDKLNAIRLQRDVIYDFDFVDRSKFVFAEIARSKELEERFRCIILPLSKLFS